MAGRNGYYSKHLNRRDPNRYLEERWRMESDGYPGRDGLTVTLIIACLLGIFMIIAFGFAVHGHAEQRPASVQEVRPMVSSDLKMSKEELRAKRAEQEARKAAHVAEQGEAVRERVEAEMVEVLEEDPDIPQGDDAGAGWAVQEGTDDAQYQEPEMQADISMYEGDFRNQGVYYDEAGRMYTWYSENELAGGGLDALNSNGRNAGEDGYIRDGDGYLAVAMPSYAWGTYSIGDEVDTPFGRARVYDWNPGESWDMYTNW